MRFNPNKGSNIKNIRAHHLLCIHGFKGKGYSVEFVQNLQKIIKSLHENPSTGIKVTSEVDEICQCCPHRRGNICKIVPDGDVKIKLRDFKTLKYLNLEEGNIYDFQQVVKLIKDKLNRNDLKEICGLCLWINDCKLHDKLS